MRADVVAQFCLGTKILDPNRRRTELTSLLLSMLFSFPCLAAAESTTAVEETITTSAGDEQESILLLPVRREGVYSGVSRTIDSLLLAEIKKARIRRLVSRDDLERLLENERLKDLLACDEVTCLTEIGGALDTDWIISGQVSAVDDAYIFGLRVFSAEDGETLAALSQTRANTRQLVDTVPRLTREAIRLARGGAPPPPPTFFTAEVATSVGGRFGQEEYYPSPGGTLRVAWGGLWPPIGWHFHIFAGLQVGHLWGDNDGPTGSIAYQRTQVALFGGLRTAIPIANDGQTRILVGLGLGALSEHAKAKKSSRSVTQIETWRLDLRLVAGFWHKLNADFSLFGNYRLRVQPGGGGVDMVSEMVALGSSASTILLHEGEIGCALHF